MEPLFQLQISRCRKCHKYAIWSIERTAENEIKHLNVLYNYEFVKKDYTKIAKKLGSFANR